MFIIQHHEYVMKRNLWDVVLDFIGRFQYRIYYREMVYDEFNDIVGVRV